MDIWLFTVFCIVFVSHTRLDGGAENAGVENAGAITYGKPKFEKRLTVFTASNLKTVAKVHNYLLRRM